MNDEVVTTERSVQHNNINILLTMHVIQDFYRHYDSLLTLTDSLGDTTVPS